jgi:hypothetical protein
VRWRIRGSERYGREARIVAENKTKLGGLTCTIDRTIRERNSEECRSIESRQRTEGVRRSNNPGGLRATVYRDAETGELEIYMKIGSGGREEETGG